MDSRLQLIFDRRSIRAYTDEEVSQDDIQSLLKAAMAAPSGSNLKPWHFVVVTDRPTLQAMADAHPYGKMLALAPLAIAVCADSAISRSWVKDCSAATENILIAAAALGLGAVWLGCHGAQDREKALRPVLGLPDRISILSIVSIGHPDEVKPARTQFDPARVHKNRW